MAPREIIPTGAKPQLFSGTHYCEELPKDHLLSAVHTQTQTLGTKLAHFKQQMGGTFIKLDGTNTFSTGNNSSGHSGKRGALFNVL